MYIDKITNLKKELRCKIVHVMINEDTHIRVAKKALYQGIAESGFTGATISKPFSWLVIAKIH